MPTLTILHPLDNDVEQSHQPFLVSGQATDVARPEPRIIESVTLQVDNGAAVQAQVTVVPRQAVPTVRFSGSVQIDSGPGPHRIMVTATNDAGVSTSKSLWVQVPTPTCTYPQSNATARSIMDELQGIVDNRQRCASFYLRTSQSQSEGYVWEEEEDHHQGLARTPLLSDGSIYYFLSHSETDSGDRGNIMQFRYAGPTEGEHVVSTTPLTIAPRAELIEVTEQHPCDMVFLPDVNGVNAGYLFVAEQNTHNLSVFHWSAFESFTFAGSIPQEIPPGGPNFVFLDRVEDRYFLGVAFADDSGGQVKLLTAAASDLFRDCAPGAMHLGAFQPASPQSIFPFPVSSKCQQCHLVRDSTGSWYLLGFRSEDPDAEFADDFVDVHPVQFSPTFQIGELWQSVHVFFNPGRTSFASTGTAYVEKSGRLLLASSYRWAEQEADAMNAFVSRVDECPS